ncbi:hypothetical protein FHU33_4610 [Blastococcus colisei]|uniref:Glycosyltransferase 2-like domain-containing protein n=1 Tax=Blastococcus colisei TaxID=1564162 RepID=A0A543P1H3_9ACTN|nr:glycosyltransferase family 2 protein [Blastococcus colisei]TQN37937.1 hypothetical protein FHU33_4610 [Blastococcus colisei]
MPELSVLLVTYNSGRHIDACLESLLQALDGIDSEILVHDNGSTDDTLDRLRRYPQAAVEEGTTNLGFAAACNLLGQRSRGRYLWFLNPDTKVHAAAARRLVEAADQRPDAGLYGARTITPGGRTVMASAQGRMTLWSLMCFATGMTTLAPSRRWSDPESMPGWDRLTSRPVPALSGGALMVGRDAWLRLGGFDSRYFMYAEDIDLCQRARRAGFLPYFVSEAIVEHEVGGSSSAGGKLVLLHRGKVTFLKKLWPPWQAYIGVHLLLAGVALRAAASRVGLFPESPGRSSGSAWQEAWRRRDEWRLGWEGAAE